MNFHDVFLLRSWYFIKDQKCLKEFRDITQFAENWLIDRSTSSEQSSGYILEILKRPGLIDVSEESISRNFKNILISLFNLLFSTQTAKKHL